MSKRVIRFGLGVWEEISRDVLPPRCRGRSGREVADRSSLGHREGAALVALLLRSGSRPDMLQYPRRGTCAPAVVSQIWGLVVLASRPLWLHPETAPTCKAFFVQWSGTLRSPRYSILGAERAMLSPGILDQFGDHRVP